ncbi:APC family permease [Companilactobacillus sp. DQM5]|uniref:APC family permease n=1 Tax=Companilactobacillus sp. DQM5 TaxID=3463359 RepID=UPI0040581501
MSYRFKRTVILRNKKISLFSTTMISLSGLIGSGWLFGSGIAAQEAGPAAIISWILGAIIIGCVALIYVELGSMFPIGGGMSRYAQFTHGSLLGFISSWANWLGLLTLLPIEAVATIQYMSTWPWKWASWTKIFFKQDDITISGLIAVIVMMIIFTLLNYWTVELMSRFTNVVIVFKMLIPILTILLFMMSSFHTENFGASLQQFMPYNTAPIFTAISSAGIILSYNAFQTVINLGNSMKNPEKNMSRAIIISLAISAVIYITLQVTFIGSLPVELIKSGWQNVSFTSPFANLAVLLNLGWFTTLLYLNAFISPLGSGVVFTTSTAMTLYSMTDNRHLPKFLGVQNKKYGIPRNAMLFNLFVGIIIIVVFKKWSILSSMISSMMLIAMLTGPVILIALRRLAPEFVRPFKVKFANVFAPITFSIISLAIYWAKFPTTIEVIGIILLGLPIYFYYENKLGWNDFKKQLKGSLWILYLLLFLGIMSIIGSKEFGGLNWIHYPLDFVVIIIVSYIFYLMGLNGAYKTEDFSFAKKINEKL